MKVNRVLLGSIVLLVVLAGLAWVFMRPAPAPPAPIRYGYLPIASDASFFVAVDQGLFDSQGLKVQAIKFETSNQAIESLVAGRVDALAPVALEATLALEANTAGQFKIVEMTAATESTKVHRILVKPASSSRSLADLQGKKIGTFPGTQMVVFLKLILGRFFPVEADLDVVQLKPPLQLQALESGQVDALFCLEPTCTQIEARGLGRPISINPLFEYIQKPFPTAAGLVSTRLTREKPDTVRRLVAALSAAHASIQARPAEAAASLPRYCPIDAGLAPRIALYDYWSLNSIDRDAVQKLSDLYSEKGILTKRLDTRELYESPPR